MIVIKTRQPDPELEQKIRMLLEREHIEAEQISIDSWEKLVLPGLTLDGMTHEVSCNGRKVSLTRLEFDLLLMLASHEGQIFSKEELFRAVWGQNCDDTLRSWQIPFPICERSWPAAVALSALPTAAMLL